MTSGRIWRLPRETIYRLNRLSKGQLAAADSRLTNPFVLVRGATAAKNAEQYERSVRLARRALCFDPGNEAVAAVLSSALAAAGKANEALEVTDAFSRGYSAPLVAARAVSQCDLGLWSAALHTVRRALAGPSRR
jgi:hypothetical protein